jgi:hypothetical protein
MSAIVNAVDIWKLFPTLDRNNFALDHYDIAGHTRANDATIDLVVSHWMDHKLVERVNRTRRPPRRTTTAGHRTPRAGGLWAVLPRRR